MAGEGDSGSSHEVPEVAPVIKEEKSCVEIAESSLVVDDAGCKNSGGPKGVKKGFLIDSDSKDPLYTSDEWRIQNFKVLGCSKRYAHDWTICPFAHPGEKARRRDPKQFTYAGIACPDMKKAGFCGRGDNCPYAHNVFEYWLHPTRYRTQLCNDGTGCSRHVCFFAHTLDEMRPASGKSLEAKKSGYRDGRVSPDTPLLTGDSTNSTASMEMWNGLSAEEKLRQSGSLPEEVAPQKAPSGAIDEVIYNLANVKLAMAGDRKNEVIGMLSQLLLEAVEEKQNEAVPHPVAQILQQPDLAAALKGLNLVQAQDLLAASQTGILGNQKQEVGPNRVPEDWQQTLQDMLKNDRTPHPLTNHRPHPNPLYTAPAGLERPNSMSGSGLESYGSDTSRGYSADLGLPPNYPQTRNFWQNKDGLGHQPYIRPPSGQVYRRMSMETGDVHAHTRLGTPAMLEGSLYSNAAADPNALRRQTFDLDDLPASQMIGGQPQDPRREARRPAISAFQSAASQDFTSAPGRSSSSDLQWGASGSHPIPGVDLGTITEGIAQFNQHNFLKQQSNADASFSAMNDRSRSTGLAGFDTGFNLLSAPLAFPTHQRGGRDPSALHSAPYDLSFAYGNGLDGPPQHSSTRRGSIDRSNQVQGWGGLNSCDFATQHF